MRALLLALGFSLLMRGAETPPPLVVHEWGTITTRHAADGRAVGRLNRIDPSEALPMFVHRFEPSTTQGNAQSALLKSPLTPGRPDVTMRLETPVIYFHPPAGSWEMPSFDVSVRFRGGVVNEFYPNGEASVDVDAERVNAKIGAGLISGWDGVALNHYVVGGLRWRGLSLADSVPLPRTTKDVWLAPRRVQSAGVTAPGGESERYLFYRGVAHLDALVRTQRSATDVRLYSPERLHWLRARTMTVPRLWLVDVRSDGRVAFRERGPIVISKRASSEELARLSLFGAPEYSRAGLERLRVSMKQALTTAGLFDDEAEAMLETWKESYFTTPGLRIFYIVPSEWTSYFLPLQISVPHVLTRVLVGRIDLLPP